MITKQEYGNHLSYMMDNKEWQNVASLLVCDYKNEYYPLNSKQRFFKWIQTEDFEQENGRHGIQNLEQFVDFINNKSNINCNNYYTNKIISVLHVIKFCEDQSYIGLNEFCHLFDSYNFCMILNQSTNHNCFFTKDDFAKFANKIFTIFIEKANDIDSYYYNKFFNLFQGISINEEINQKIYNVYKYISQSEQKDVFLNYSESTLLKYMNISTAFNFIRKQKSFDKSFLPDVEAMAHKNMIDKNQELDGSIKRPRGGNQDINWFINQSIFHREFDFALAALKGAHQVADTYTMLVDLIAYHVDVVLFEKFLAYNNKAFTPKQKQHIEIQSSFGCPKYKLMKEWTAKKYKNIAK
jgi:hypothetical protein